jgi:2-oxopent-4-enoate/cis-2-oxohex-4-enoate hydratase
MDETGIARYGDELFEALRGRKTIDPVTEREPDITLEDAYRISLWLLGRRLEDGETIIGKKIGVTSAAVQDMLDVRQPDFGWLTDRMAYEDGADMPISRELIQPRAEAEIAFRLARPLEGPGVTTADVLAATEAVVACFEVVDSRVHDWRIRIQDTIADNASSGLFVTGSKWVEPGSVDLATAPMVVSKNGAVISRGTGATSLTGSPVLGTPVACVAWLANTLAGFATGLKAGDIILSGSLVPLEPVEAGDHMHVDVGGLGTATVHFV